MSRRLASAVLVSLLTCACAAGGGANGSESATARIRVGAFDFAESELLAELYATALEAAQLPVERLGQVGPREIVAPALQLDQIDVVPEYLGSAGGYFGATDTSLAGLRAAAAPLGLSVLDPASAEDVNVVVVTVAAARVHELDRISDLEGLAAELVIGGPVECPDRPLCLLGLESTYGLTFASFVPQRSLEVTAEALVRGEIDVGVMFSTSAQLDDEAFVVLEDDLGLQPPENVVPLVRADALERWGPSLSEALDQLSARLTTAALRSMNRRVDSGEAVDQVARSWLVDAGLIDG